MRVCEGNSEISEGPEEAGGRNGTEDNRQYIILCLKASEIPLGILYSTGRRRIVRHPARILEWLFTMK